MQNFNKKQKTISTVIGTVIIFIIGIFLMTKEEKKSDNNYEQYIIEENTESKDTEKEKIQIHVIGEVENEGVVEVDEGSRIIDIIEAAGGSSEEADLNKVNLAYEVEDGQKIYIPNINDEKDYEYITSDSGEGIIESNEKKSLININKATQTELETLPGIGPSTALKIINYREENGMFKKIDDIQNVSGIGEEKFNNIKEYISTK